MLEKNNRFNYGVDSGRGDAQNLSNLQNAYPSSRHSWFSMGVKGAVLGLGLATLLPLTASAADYPGPWPGEKTVGGTNLDDVKVDWESDEGRTPEGIYLTYGTPIDDTYVLQGRITATKKDDGADVTSTGKFQFVLEKVLYPVGGPYDVFAYFFLDPEKSTLTTDDYDGRQHQYLYVTAAKPELKWDDPEPITYGTKLSDIQLNAQCTTIDAATIDTKEYGKDGAILDGDYTYSPAAGEVLDATQTKDGEILLNEGYHTLTVTFVPKVKGKDERNENYEIVTKTVKLIVYPADLTDDQFSWGDPTLDTLTYGDEFTTDNIHYTTNVPGTISTAPDMLNTQPDANENGYPLDLTFTPDSKNYNPVTAKRPLIVKKADPKLEWETPARVEKGTLFAKDATATGIDAKTLPGTFVYDPAFPVTLDQVPAQTLKATFTPTDVDNYNTAEITKTVEVFTKIPVILTWATPDPITYGTPLALAMEMNQRGIKVDGIQLNALATTEDGTPVDGRYVYIPEEGNVLPVGTHKLKVTFTPTDTNKYKTVEYTDENGLNHSFVWLEVTKAALTITADSETIKYNEPAPTYTYQITSGALVGKDEIQVELNCDYIQGDADKGNVRTYDIVPSIDTNAAVGTTTANSVADNYDITLVNGKLTVEPADLSDNEFKLDYIDVLTYGDVFTTAKIHTSGTVEGTLTTDPVVDRIPNANEDGYALKVTFTPNTKNYNPKTVDGTLIVKKADPEITWEPASPITYGTPLGEEQLNATFKWTVDGKDVSLNIPGNTATYAPEEGKVLPAGPQTLKLVSFKAENGDSFRPGHPENYNEVKDVTREIVVEKADLTITIDNKSILFDEEAPDYTYTIDGFVNGDTVDSVFGKAPVATSDYVKGKPIGTYTITIDPAPTANNYNVKVVDGTLTVGVKEPDIIWIKPLPIIQGTPLGRDDGELRGKLDPTGKVQLNALAVEDKNADPLVEITGTYVYEPKEGTDDLPLGENILSVTFTPDQQYAGNYKAATAVVVLLVQAKPVIEWADPQTISYTNEKGERSTMGELLNATVTVDGKDISYLGNFRYTWMHPKDPNKPEINPQGNTPLVGTYTDHMKVEFILNDAITDYAQPDPVIVDLIVTKGTPVIAWNPAKLGPNEPVPAGMAIPVPPVYQLPDITYGTELTDADQLNAYVCKSTTNTNKANITGTMIYTVPATKLPAGWNTLYVTFTPTGDYAKNYDAVTVFNLIYVEYAELSDDDVTWVDAPFTVPYGTKLNVITHYTLTAEVDGEEIKGTVINKKMDGQDASAIEDAPAVGSYTLTATFDPDKNSEPSKNYKAKDKTTTFTVEKATPNIDLIEEDPQQPNTITIVYGTPIDDKFAAETFIATNPIDDTIEVDGTYTFDVFEQVEDASTQSGWSWSLIEKDLTQEYLDVVINYEDPAPYQIVAHFTPKDGDNYESATTDPYDLFVVPADPEIGAENPIEIPYGTELTEASFKATATGVDEEEVDGDFTYFVGDTELSKLTQPLGKGTYEGTVKFASKDTNYKDGSTTVTIYVYGSVYIEWTPAVWDAEKEQAQIEFGTPLTKADQLNAVALDAEDRKTEVDGDMVYEVETSDGGKLPAVDGMVLPAGTYTLWAEFTPNDTDKYDPTKKPVKLVVAGKDPHVSWYPFPLFYGQTPGDGQYNARAEVGGQFDYPEEPEWPVEPGVWHLDAPFTPENPNYADSVAHGVLVIMKAPIRFEWPAQDLYYGETPTAEKQFNARVYSVATGEDITDKGEFEYPINELTDKSPVGVYTLVAPWHLKDQKDAERYESGIAYANVEVLGADPTEDLTWNPEALPYGEKASDKQKNATKPDSIKGHFEYPNMDGHNVGEYNVTANFISEDPNYTNSEVSATLKVTQAAPSIKFYKVVPAEEEGKDPTYEELPDPIEVPYGAELKENEDGTITIAKPENEEDESEVESASETVVNDNNGEEGDGKEDEEEESESEDLTIKVFVTGVDKKDVAGKVTFTLDDVALDKLEQPLDPKEDPYKLKAAFASEDANYADGSASIDLIVKIDEEGAVDVDWDVPDRYDWSEGLVWGAIDPATGRQLGNKDAVAWNAYTGYPLAWDDQLTYKYAPVDPDLVPEEDIDDMTLEEALKVLNLTEEDLIDFVLGKPVNAGTYFLVAWYNDEVFGYGDDKEITEIYQAEPDLAIGELTFTYGTILYPASFECYAYGTDGNYLTGDIEFYVDEVPLAEVEQPLEFGEYDLTVVFTPDNTNYESVELEATLTIIPNAEDIKVSWNVLPMQFDSGIPVNLDAVAVNTATGDVLAEGHQLFYTIMDDIELTEELSLTLFAGEYPVKAEFIGTGVYEGITASTTGTLVVEPAEPTLSWKPDPLTYGTAATEAQKNASANVQPGEFVYPDMSNLPVGQNEVTAKFISGNPNYADGEVSAILEVTKATPVIRWATPAPIYYGTLLSDEQLNATANVDGTFKYTPAAGTELEIGTYTLIAEFTPKDTANYNTATASVELEVIPNVEVEITWEPKSPITYGTILSVEQLNATANVEGHFYYNPTYGFVVTPDSQFVVNGKLKLTVTFVPTDRKHFKNAYKEVFIDIVTDEDEDTTDDGDEAPALTISKAGSVKGMVNAAADALVITYTGTLEESTDGVTWTPVADAKDGTYVVDVKVASKKFYRSVK